MFYNKCLIWPVSYMTCSLSVFAIERSVLGGNVNGDLKIMSVI